MATIHRNITSSPPSTWPRRRLAVSIAGGGGGVALGLMGAGSGGVVESGCCCGGRGGSLSSATSGQEAARGWRRAERRGEERSGALQAEESGGRATRGWRRGQYTRNLGEMHLGATGEALLLQLRRALRAGNKWRFCFFFLETLCKSGDEWTSMKGGLYYCIIGRDCFDLGDENVIGDRCTTVESNFVKATFESYFKNPILQFQ